MALACLMFLGIQISFLLQRIPDTSPCRQAEGAGKELSTCCSLDNSGRRYQIVEENTFESLMNGGRGRRFPKDPRPDVVFFDQGLESSGMDPSEELPIAPDRPLRESLSKWFVS